jgi:hypothetical protein
VKYRSRAHGGDAVVTDQRSMRWCYLGFFLTTKLCTPDLMLHDCHRKTIGSPSAAGHGSEGRRDAAAMWSLLPQLRFLQLRTLMQPSERFFEPKETSKPNMIPTSILEHVFSSDIKAMVACSLTRRTFRDEEQSAG